MATTEQLPPSPELPSSDEQHERDFARKLAERYRLSFIDLKEQRIDPELFRTIPADLMFRYNFVPLEVQNNVLSIAGDRLTRDSTASPVVRLVETVIFTALERRASDIHIEARDTEVAVKYRIDGVLQHAMQPISKEWHSTVLSRIKVLSDLDIAERRIPQDGRFRVKYK